MSPLKSKYFSLYYKNTTKCYKYNKNKNRFDYCYRWLFSIFAPNKQYNERTRVPSQRNLIIFWRSHSKRKGCPYHQKRINSCQELSEETGTSWFVVKAQIHAGGRGKGGGVKLAKGIDKVEEVVDSILGMDLVTPQTPPEGKRVHQVLIAEDVYYPGASEPEEYYMSVLLNRSTGSNMIMYSTEGGVDIETVAEETPHLIFTEDIDPAVGLMPFQARRVAFNLGLSGNAFKEMTRFVTALYSAYVQSDSSLFEINPVLKTSDDKILAVDAKVSLDDNALFRHKDYQELRDVKKKTLLRLKPKK